MSTSPDDPQYPAAAVDKNAVSTTHSLDSSSTHVQMSEKPVTQTPHNHKDAHDPYPPGHGESALPADKVEEEIENEEEDWERDPENARNWPLARKWTAVAVLSFYTFVSPLASSMMAPGLTEIAIKYQLTDPTIIAMTLCVFLLSFAIGPLFLAPLSEMYGRTWILHISNIFSLGFSIGCAFAPTTNSLIAFRFLAGLSSSAPIAIGGGSVGDLFSERDRASAMAVFSMGPLIGPVVGPVAGGFIAQTIGVRYVFIVIAGICGLAGAVGIPVLKETYAPVIRMRRALKAGNPEAAARAHPMLLKAHGSKWHVLWINLTRPIHLLFGSMICFVLSAYQAFLYGIFYLMFATFAKFFADTYHFKPGVGGLAYLGLGIGFAAATVVGAKSADQIYKYLGEKNGGVTTPEMRIPALFFGSFFVPIGLFWYGWSAEAKLHWIMPIIGTGIFAFGMMTVFLPIQLYLVDSFVYAASATSAASLFRSLFGFAFPLFGQQMFDKLGLGPGNSLLGGLAIILGIPFPVWLWFNGEKLRARNPLTRDSYLKGQKAKEASQPSSQTTSQA